MYHPSLRDIGHLVQSENRSSHTSLETCVDSLEVGVRDILRMRGTVTFQTVWIALFDVERACSDRFLTRRACETVRMPGLLQRMNAFLCEEKSDRASGRRRGSYLEDRL